MANGGVARGTNALTRAGRWALTVLSALTFGEVAAAAGQDPAAARVAVFLDCGACYDDFLRTEVTFVNFVRDPAEADVHVLITDAGTASGGREYTLAFLGQRAFAGTQRTLRTVTTTGESEDVVRRQLATALRIGLLDFVARESVPEQLAVDARLGGEQAAPAAAVDRWNHWIFSLRGSAAFDGEESNREWGIGVDVGADRITPEWKITFGLEVEHEREEFDLDEDDPVAVERRGRDFQWLVVKALGEHWSVGAEGDVESSTFDNTELSISAAPALEYNLFPYSLYTRRQLRTLYSVGVQANRYYETTLLGETSETLPAHSLSVTYDQRERWGSLQARTEWSQYLHDASKTRLEVESEIGVRIARGFSIEAEVNASRIRDQIFLPARGATPEEILLRLRQLQSGYEYRTQVSLTYTFGSIFSAVVNPRFGQ